MYPRRVATSRLCVLCHFRVISVSVPRGHLSWRRCDLCWLWQFLGLWACCHCPCIPVRMSVRGYSLFRSCSCLPLRWPFGLENPAVFRFRRVSPEVILLAAYSCAVVGLQLNFDCSTFALYLLDSTVLHWICFIGLF